jgi:YggT family protein
MQAIIYLIQTVFFFFIAAALLRVWLNAYRMQFGQQPGPLILALTDWLVKPIRKGLPIAWAQMRWDMSSLLAACLLAVAQALILKWLWLLDHDVALSFVVEIVSLMALPIWVFQILLRAWLQLVFGMLLIMALLSWTQPYSPALGWLSKLLNPLLDPVRRIVPPLGGVDLSSLVLMLLVQALLMVV